MCGLVMHTLEAAFVQPIPCTASWETWLAVFKEMWLWAQAMEKLLG